MSHAASHEQRDPFVEVLLREQARKRDEALADPWDVPIPLEHPPLPPFPVDALPPAAAAIVHATARQLQCDPAIPGVAALTTISAMVLGSAVPGFRWHEPSVGLYMLAVSGSGTGKSPAIDTVLRPVFDGERHAREAAAPEIRRIEQERRIAEQTVRHAEANAARGKPSDQRRLLQEAREAQDRLAGLPDTIEPRILVQDTTPEALARLVASHRRLFVADTEGGVFGTFCGRYADGRAFLDALLKPYSGEGFRIDRVSKPAVIVDDALLAALLTVQPDVLREVLGHRETVGRGLVARFGIVLARRRPRDVRRLGLAIPADVHAEWAQLVRKLHTTDTGAEPVRVPGTPTACDVFIEYEEHLEQLQRKNDIPEVVRSWIAKQAGRTHRIAVALHCGDGYEPSTPITAEIAHRSIEIARVIEAHSLAALEMAGLDAAHESARLVLAAAQAGRLPDICSQRDIQRSCRGFKSATEVRSGLKRLQEHGFARPLPPTSLTGHGRKTYEWQFHPDACAQRDRTDETPIVPSVTPTGKETGASPAEVGEGDG